MKLLVSPQGPRSRKWSQSWRFLGHIVVCSIFLAATVAFAWPGQAQNTTQPTAQGETPGQGQVTGRSRGRGIQPDREHPILAIGAPAPDFSLPGIDGKNHTLGEYANAKILAVVFESNHCPVSIAYEDRIRQIREDYKNEGVALIAINANNASAVRLNELGYTDMTDDMKDMKTRAALRHIDWPYLYDGETQTTAAKFGAVATPHMFIFDADRKLRYQGRIDDSTRVADVKSNDARKALDALVAGKPVPVTVTPTFGCSTKWLSKAGDVQAEWKKIQAEPVTLDMAGADDLKKLRANSTGKTIVVDFWSTKCKDCSDEFDDFETTYRMYRLRKFDLITVSTDNPSAKSQVMDFLKQQHASGTNLQFDSADTRALQAAVGAKWKLGEPFMMVIGPDGNVVFQKAGKVDILQVRRHVLATIPNEGPWAGVQEYWSSVTHGN